MERGRADVNRDTAPGIAARLRDARQQAGVTQKQAAAQCGCLRVRISTLETSDRPPKLATLYKLAAAYGVDMWELLPTVAEVVRAMRPAAGGKRTGTAGPRAPDAC